MADEVTMIDGRRLRCAIAADALGDVGRKRRQIEFRDEDLGRGGVVTDALQVNGLKLRGRKRVDAFASQTQPESRVHEQCATLWIGKAVPCVVVAKHAAGSGNSRGRKGDV